MHSVWFNFTALEKLRIARGPACERSHYTMETVHIRVSPCVEGSSTSSRNDDVPLHRDPAACSAYCQPSSHRSCYRADSCRINMRMMSDTQLQHTCLWQHPNWLWWGHHHFPARKANSSLYGCRIPKYFYEASHGQGHCLVWSCSHPKRLRASSSSVPSLLQRPCQTKARVLSAAILIPARFCDARKAL